jgi:alkylhydroperoxidase/carboxymuconolactone decarboxylase family protein YurZ
MICCVIAVSANPLDAYKEFYPEAIQSFNRPQDLVFCEGTLPQKFKVLTAIAIDVEHGALQGATALGRRALKLGATKDEIIETLRVSYYVGGNRALFTSAKVLQNLFKQKP